MSKINVWMPRPGMSLYTQFLEYLKEQIKTGQYPYGFIFPPYRTIEKNHGISRNTISNAFKHLVSEGYIESTDKGAFKVVYTETVSSSKGGAWLKYLGSADICTASAQKLTEDTTDSIFHNIDGYNECVRAACSKLTEINYNNITNGLPQLLEHIISALYKRGIHADVSRILVVPSYSTGIYLIQKALFGSTTTLLSAHTDVFSNMLNGPENQPYMVCVPTDNLGIIPDALERFTNGVVRPVLFFEPLCSYPAGIATAPDRITDILHVCEKNNVFIIESDIYRDLWLGDHQPPVKSYDNKGMLYMSSLMTGMSQFDNVCFFTGPEYLINHLIFVYRQISNTMPLLNQLIAAELIGSSAYDGYMNQTRAVLADRINSVCSCLEEHMEGFARWERPHGGRSILLHFNEEIDTRYLGLPADLCSWRPFSGNKGRYNSIILSITTDIFENIEQFIIILASRLNRICNGLHRVLRKAT